jgi:hypothetical protein
MITTQIHEISKMTGDNTIILKATGKKTKLTKRASRRETKEKGEMRHEEVS